MIHVHAAAAKNIKTVMEKKPPEKTLASYIDHTLLKPETTLEQVHRLCDETLKFGFASACFPPYFIRHLAPIYQSKPLNISTVIGFPFGYSSTYIKVEEAKRAMELGAQELDVVINLGALRSELYNDLFNEIQSITTLAHLKGVKVKWIIEAGLLNDTALKRVCDLAIKADVDFVKTSTGFNGPGASVEMIKTLRTLLPKKILIKASGGIKTYEQVLQLIDAGASRIGTSSAMQIIQSLSRVAAE
jgi:deoxyribose-phosphate aldolase